MHIHLGEVVFGNFPRVTVHFKGLAKSGGSHNPCIWEAEAGGSDFEINLVSIVSSREGKLM